MAGKAKNTPEADFPGGRGGGGSGVRDMALPSLGNLRAKFSETSFPRSISSFQDLFYANRPLLSLNNNFKKRLIPLT